MPVSHCGADSLRIALVYALTPGGSSGDPQGIPYSVTPTLEETCKHFLRYIGKVEVTALIAIHECDWAVVVGDESNQLQSLPNSLLRR